MKRGKKRSYFEITQERYQKADRAKKGLILNEFCETQGYNRKYAIRKLSQVIRRRKPKAHKRQGRPLYDKAALMEPLRAIWAASGYVCSKRLQALIPEWLPSYEEEQGKLAEPLGEALCRLSCATLDRWLAPYRAEGGKRKKFCGTKPGTLLRNQIPIKTGEWDVQQPGFLEADSVAHCGTSLTGSFAWSLTYTDIFSTWTENRATWNKGAEGVKQRTAEVEKALPFPLLGFDCDNGSEFLNYPLVRYFTERAPGQVVQFTRSRPYHKDDNAHVEQKNWTHVRQLFGYQRFDKIELVDLMNDLYANEWSLYQNHFCPSMKLKEKVRVGARYRKKYDTPQTPYQRLLECEHFSEEAKERLRLVHQGLNPFQLKRVIDQKVKRILQLASQ